MESRKHDAAKLLRTVPLLGRAYCGLALETRSSADYRFEDGQLVRAKKPVFIRGLNRNHNHDLKNLFKSAATTASAIHGPFREFYEGLLARIVNLRRNSPASERIRSTAHCPCAPSSHACLAKTRNTRRMYFPDFPGYSRNFPVLDPVDPLFTACSVTHGEGSGATAGQADAVLTGL